MPTRMTYREWMWQAMGRFDYTPEDCLAFGEAIERVVVPRVRALDGANVARPLKR